MRSSARRPRPSTPSLDAVSAALNLAITVKDGQVQQMQLALKKFNEQIGILEQQKVEIEKALDELRRTFFLTG